MQRHAVSESEQSSSGTQRRLHASQTEEEAERFLNMQGAWLLLLTVHRASLWLRGGRRHSEVCRQRVGRTQRHAPHVFGPELLPP